MIFIRFRPLWFGVVLLGLWMPVWVADRGGPFASSPTGLVMGGLLLLAVVLAGTGAYFARTWWILLWPFLLLIPAALFLEGPPQSDLYGEELAPEATVLWSLILIVIPVMVPAIWLGKYRAMGERSWRVLARRHAFATTLSALFMSAVGALLLFMFIQGS